MEGFWVVRGFGEVVGSSASGDGARRVVSTTRVGRVSGLRFAVEGRFRICIGVIWPGIGDSFLETGCEALDAGAFRLTVPVPNCCGEAGFRTSVRPWDWSLDAPLTRRSMSDTFGGVVGFGEVAGAVTRSRFRIFTALGSA